jgi:hypothetical protein
MAGRSWTELFFLDEAVALAAGHRPCFLCRREAAERFRDSWAAAKGGPALPPKRSTASYITSGSSVAASASIRSLGRWPHFLMARWSWQQDRPLPFIRHKPIDGQTRVMPHRSGFTTLRGC